MIEKGKKKCLHNKNVYCDIFDDLINCWYSDWDECRKMKSKREKKKKWKSERLD